VKRAVLCKAIVEVARAASPPLAFDEAGFLAFVEARRSARPEHGRDLLLVYLWSVGSTEATHTLEAEYLNQVPLVVAAIDPSPAFIADVVQELKAKLYAERRLLQYAGSGPLGGWLRRAALNTASTLLRPQRQALPVDPSSDELAPDVELTYLKHRYGPEFRTAFIEALGSLTARERTVLRLNSLSQVSIDELGVMYSVHRATVARWVQVARAKVVERTRETLIARLGLGAEELDELLSVLQSQLDVSLRRHLA
jgi:RNA polymerase sigma-70 factor (ECF subfamily)